MPLQTAAGVFVLVNLGVGFTVTVMFWVLEQVFAVVIILYVTSAGLAEGLVKISPIIAFPDPAALLMLAANALDQVNVAPVVKDAAV